MPKWYNRLTHRNNFSGFPVQKIARLNRRKKTVLLDMSLFSKSKMGHNGTVFGLFLCLSFEFIFVCFFFRYYKILTRYHLGKRRDSKMERSIDKRTLRMFKKISAKTLSPENAKSNTFKRFQLLYQRFHNKIWIIQKYLPLWPETSGLRIRFFSDLKSFHSDLTQSKSTNRMGFLATDAPSKAIKYVGWKLR